MKLLHPRRAAWLVALTLSACVTKVRFEDGGGGTGGSSSSSALGGGGEASSSSTPSTSASTSSGTAGAGGESAQEAAALVAEQCPNVASEKHFCITLSYPNQLYALGPDTGNLCHLGDVEGLDGGDVSSIAVVGPHVHGCSYDVGPWRASVLGGPAEFLPIPCESLTDYQSGFLLAADPFGSTLEHHSTFESIDGGTPLQTFEIEGQYSRMTARGETLYAAWHSTNILERHSLSTGETLPSLSLDGFDDWVHGLSVTDGRVYVLSTGGQILAFDVETGAQLQLATTDAGFLTALHCWSN